MIYKEGKIKKMPELPEVETTRRGIEPLLLPELELIHVREMRLMARNFARSSYSEVLNVTRRAKYILIGTKIGALVVHLGMSGSLRVVTPDDAPRLDHIDIEIRMVRGTHNDPRRFGSFHFARILLRALAAKEFGARAAGNEFSGDYLFATSAGARWRLRITLWMEK